MKWAGLETPKCVTVHQRVKHVRDKVEDHYWEVHGLAEYYSVQEFTFRIRRHPDDDPNEESSSESDTTSDSDSDDDPVTDDDICV